MCIMEMTYGKTISKTVCDILLGKYQAKNCGLLILVESATQDKILTFLGKLKTY